MTTEEKVAELERRMADVEQAVAVALAPLPYSLEDQHRLKVAARALGKKEGR